MWMSGNKAKLSIEIRRRNLNERNPRDDQQQSVENDKPKRCPRLTLRSKILWQRDDEHAWSSRSSHDSPGWARSNFCLHQQYLAVDVPPLAPTGIKFLPLQNS